jgi:hypothetical protein
MLQFQGFSLFFTVGTVGIIEAIEEELEPN